MGDNWFKKIFGKRKPQVQCAFCGRHLIKFEIGLVREPARLAECGLYCAACNKITCAECSVRAAGVHGKDYHICPDCLAGIGDTLGWVGD